MEVVTDSVRVWAKPAWQKYLFIVCQWKKTICISIMDPLFRDAVPGLP